MASITATVVEARASGVGELKTHLQYTKKSKSALVISLACKNLSLVPDDGRISVIYARGAGTSSARTRRVRRVLVHDNNCEGHTASGHVLHSEMQLDNRQVSGMPKRERQ